MKRVLPGGFEEEEPTISSVTIAKIGEVCFEQNSKQMYDKILEGSPNFIRSVVQKNMNNAIADVCLELVTETAMYEVVKRASPRPFVKFGINVLDEHKLLRFRMTPGECV